MIRPTVMEIATALDRPQILSASVIDTGQNNLVLDGDGLIVRVPRHDQARADLVREVGILAALAPQLPLPVPAPELRTMGAYAVAIHPKLPGKPLLSLAELDEAQRRELAGRLAEFLRTLHSLPVELLPNRAADPFAEWRHMLDEVEAKVFPLVSDDIGRRIAQRFRRFLAGGDGHPAEAIIHGDFGTGNILVENGRISGVIDFAGCGIGDPAYDFASLSAGLGDEFVALMQPHYVGIAAMRDRIRFYRSTFALLDVLHGLEHGDGDALNAGLDTVM